MTEGIMPFIMMFGFMTAPNASQANQYEAATRKSAEAFYISSGTKAEVDKMFKVVEERYIPEIVKKYGPITGYVGQIVVEQKLSVKFDF